MTEAKEQTVELVGGPLDGSVVEVLTGEGVFTASAIFHGPPVLIKDFVYSRTDKTTARGLPAFDFN